MTYVYRKSLKACLHLYRYQTKLSFHHQPIKPPHSETPFISFGSPIQLDNGDSKLAAEMNDMVSFFPTHM